jgi:hypothetical protein
LIKTVEYEDPHRVGYYPDPGCDFIGCEDGIGDQSFSITFEQDYPTLTVKLLFGVGKKSKENCSGKDPEIVILTNQ